MAQVAVGVQMVAAPAMVGVHLVYHTLAVDDQGTALEVEWPDIAGATAVEVESASIAIQPVGSGSPGRSLSTVTGAFEGSDLTITVPGGARAIRSFYLNGFQVFSENWRTVRNPSDLPGGWRVAISLPQGNGFSAPAFAVPGVELNPGIIPTVLAGASLQERVLRLPDVEAPRFRLQVLSGDFPDGLRPESFRVSSISARAAPEPVDLEVLDAAGEPVWAQDGRLAAPATIDLKASLKRDLGQAIAAGQGPRTAATVRANKPGEVRTTGLITKGKVVRSVPGKVTVICEGETRPLPLPAPALDPRVPSAAIADVVVRHHGLRLHPISDPLPGRIGDLTGPVLDGAGPVLRLLPPEAMMGEELRRVGVIAIVGTSTEVSARVMEVVGGVATRALGDGAVTLTVEPLAGFASAQPRVLWFDLPKPIPIDRALGVEAVAARGRLLWVAGAGGVGGVRFGVTAAEPTGEAVRIGGQEIVLTARKTELLRHSLSPPAFAGAAPLVETDQFCDVVLSNLTLEYRA